MDPEYSRENTVNPFYGKSFGHHSCFELNTSLAKKPEFKKQLTDYVTYSSPPILAKGYVVKITPLVWIVFLYASSLGWLPVQMQTCYIEASWPNKEGAVRQKSLYATANPHDVLDWQTTLKGACLF